MERDGMNGTLSEWIGGWINYFFLNKQVPEINPPFLPWAMERCVVTNSEQWHSSILCWAWVRLGSTWLKGTVPESVTHNLFLTVRQIAKTGAICATLRLFILFHWLSLHLWTLHFHLFHRSKVRNLTYVCWMFQGHFVLKQPHGVSPLYYSFSSNKFGQSGKEVSCIDLLLSAKIFTI